MTIQAFLDYLLLEKNYSKHTVLAYKGDLLFLKKFCEATYDTDDLLSISYPQLRTWIVAMVTARLSNRTINRKVNAAKSFYTFLQKKGQLKNNPLAKHKALKTIKKVQVPFTPDEINGVIHTLDIADDFISIRDRLMVELFYATGMRRTELVALELGAIDRDQKTVKVLGKRNKERNIPLIPSVMETIEEYLKKRKQVAASEEPSLFVTKKGTKVYETLVYRVIHAYFSKVSTKLKKSPHILRHSFATHLLNQGADINSVKELLGHSSLASTQVYTHSSLENIKKVYNKTHPRSRKIRKI